MAENADLIGRLKACYGADNDSFEREILHLIRGYAAYVHLLPATADHYFSGQLGAYWEYGSTAAHTITYAEVDARSLDYVCGGWEQGWSGYLNDSSMAACLVWGIGNVHFTATSPGFYHAVAAYWLGYNAGGGPVQIATGTHYDY